MEHFVDFSLVLLLFGGHRFWACWGPSAGDTSALTFALNYCPFLNIWVSARQDFDSGGDFKGKVGAEDDVVGKVQKDELSMILKCFNSFNEIEDLVVLGCLGKARMSAFIGIYNV